MKIKFIHILQYIWLTIFDYNFSTNSQWAYLYFSYYTSATRILNTSNYESQVYDVFVRFLAFNVVPVGVKWTNLFYSV